MTDKIDRARTGIAAAGEALDLAARLASLAEDMRPDQQAKARRMRARAARITARSASAPPRRAARLRAKAAGLLVAAEALSSTSR
jgi:hypothetical protein